MENQNYLIVFYHSPNDSHKIEFKDLIDSNHFLQINTLLENYANEIQNKLNTELYQKFEIKEIINLLNQWSHMVLIRSPNYEFSWILKSLLYAYYGSENIECSIGCS
jgi:hypothetical protein